MTDDDGNTAECGKMTMGPEIAAFCVALAIYHHFRTTSGGHGRAIYPAAAMERSYVAMGGRRDDGIAEVAVTLRSNGGAMLARIDLEISHEDGQNRLHSARIGAAGARTSRLPVGPPLDLKAFDFNAASAPK